MKQDWPADAVKFLSQIAQFLKNNAIRYQYEPVVLINSAYDKPRIWCADFSLQELGTHIEYFGVLGFIEKLRETRAYCCFHQKNLQPVNRALFMLLVWSHLPFWYLQRSWVFHHEDFPPDCISISGTVLLWWDRGHIWAGQNHPWPGHQPSFFLIIFDKDVSMVSVVKGFSIKSWMPISCALEITSLLP